jgi:COP9 signalosome complex subunit 1
MAEAFNTPLAALEVELAGLIADNEIAARIDSHNKRLIQRRQDQRTDTFHNVIKTGDSYTTQTRDMLWRISLAQA